jgi:hypothetical protein
MSLGDKSSLELDSSISTSQQIVLNGFFSHLKEALKEPMTADEFNMKAKEAMSKYQADLATEKHIKNLKAALEKSKADLEQTRAHNAALKRKAHAKAGMLLGAGFLGCVGQLGFFTYTIYGLYGWNDMEPVTWMFCKFTDRSSLQRHFT